MMTAAATRFDDTTRTWTHIKVLYILSILLSAVVLALFVVCFMMVLEVQRGLNNEVTLRKERENEFLKNIFENGEPQAKASSQRAEIITSVDENPDPIVVRSGEADLRISASTLTQFCASIHSHCPLRGPEGPPGIPGLGEKGNQGTIGVRGYPGPQGLKGSIGPRGARGEIGAPGFGLLGPPGPAGNRGVKGDKGGSGTNGRAGPKGEVGSRGPAGESIKGDSGKNGAKGATGLPGHDGLNGLTGLKGDKGEAGDMGTPGKKGELGMMGFPGRAGSPGNAGDKGDQGSVGSQGLIGIPGTKGSKGEPGLRGSGSQFGFATKGEKGASGLPGNPGPMGSPGDPGKHGVIGPTGSPGQPGGKGNSGFPGAMGSPGISGRPGLMGLSGQKGMPGFPGVSGSPGSVGAPGPAGMDGFKGEKGDPGVAGAEITAEKLTELNITHLLKGEPGMKGESGELGPIGRRGKRGEKGDSGNIEQCECQVGPAGEKGDPGVCPGTTPSYLLYQNKTIPDRKKDVTIRKIGTPILLRKTPFDWGAWMVDSDPTPVTEGKYYMTQHFTGNKLYEYANLARFDSANANYSKQYTIQDLFYGTGGAMYRGAFFYHRAGLNMIGRYDLESKVVTAQLPIEESLYRGSSTLFATGYNCYDLAVDENGLWLVYAFQSHMSEPAHPETLLVAKLESNYLDIEKTWNITVPRNSFRNSFIAQGILYLLKNENTKRTQISFAYDLYSNAPIEIELRLHSEFRDIKMLAYDYASRNIMAWDGKNAVTYPIISE